MAEFRDQQNMGAIGFQTALRGYDFGIELW